MGAGGGGDGAGGRARGCAGRRGLCWRGRELARERAQPKQTGVLLLLPRCSAAPLGLLGCRDPRPDPWCSVRPFASPFPPFCCPVFPLGHLASRLSSSCDRSRGASLTWPASPCVARQYSLIFLSASFTCPSHSARTSLRLALFYSPLLALSPSCLLCV